MPTLTRGRSGAPASPGTALTATLALLTFVAPLGVDMYLPAFPRMVVDLGTDASGAQLTLTAFLSGMAAGQLVLGPLSDRYGRRAPIVIGAAACTAATALCALAPALGTLIALRFAMGFTGAAGIVVGRAVVSDLADGTTAARLFGLLAALGGIAPIVAPLAGGAVAAATGGWRGVFWVLAAASLLVASVAAAVIPESLPAHRRHAGGAAATLRAARAVLADRVYLGYTLAFCFSFGALFCYIAGSPFLLQNVLGLGVGHASAAFAAGALTATLSSAAGTRLVERVAPVVLLRAGLFTLLAATVAALVVTAAGQLDRWWAFGLVFVAFAGLGQVFGPATALALERVPHAVGTGSAVLGAGQSLLGALVAPLMGIGGAHTALPLFAGMAGCALVAVLALALTRGVPGVPRR